MSDSCLKVEIVGRIKEIGETKTFKNDFTVREFVVSVANGEYPQDIAIQVVKDNCAKLDDFGVCQLVSCQCDIKGREYDGRHFVNIQCWKIVTDEESVKRPDTPPENVDEVNPDEDKLPF